MGDTANACGFLCFNNYNFQHEPHAERRTILLTLDKTENELP
jgi:hypothetical protein